MGVLNLAEYEKSEAGPDAGSSSGAETNAGAVKHNGSMGQSAGALASRDRHGQAGTAGNGAGEKAKDRYMASDMTPEATAEASPVEETAPAVLLETGGDGVEFCGVAAC